jgi:integrase
MKTPFRIRPYRDSNRPALKFVVNYREAGKRARKFFETKRDAETFSQIRSVEFQNTGREGMEFPAALRVMAGEAADMLAPFGKTIRDATAFYVAHLRQQEKSIPLSAAIAELVALKTGAEKSDRYTHDLELRLGRLARDHGDQSVATFNSKMLDGWLAGLAVAPGTRNTFRRDLRTLFSFCVKRGYTPSNPAKETEAVKLPDTPPGILTTGEAARLLDAADDDTRAYVAINLFAGLISAELEKLDWQNVNLESGLIEVTAATAKTKRRRLVKIEPNLAAWLAPLAQPAGPVAPTSALRDRLDAARRRAGFGTPGTETPAEKKAKVKLKAWPQNAGRHSFGSYWLAEHQDAAALALQMGNSVQMVFSHYREIVQPKDAARFWSIAPEATGKKIVSIGKAAA